MNCPSKKHLATAETVARCFWFKIHIYTTVTLCYTMSVSISLLPTFLPKLSAKAWEETRRFEKIRKSPLTFGWWKGCKYKDLRRNPVLLRRFIRWSKSYLFAMAGFPRILKNPCASKENRFPKLNLPTVYQRNRRAKLAVNTQTPVHGRFCHRTGVSLFARWSLRSTDKK